MKTISKFSFILFFACACSAAMAQHHVNRTQGDQREQTLQKQEKIQSLRIAYFVEELQLNEEESMRFWPVWNEIHDGIESIQSSIKALEDQINEIKSDKEAEDLATSLNNLHAQMLEQRHLMTSKLAEIIGYKRALSVHILEREFRGQILRARMNGSNGSHRGPGMERGPQQGPGPQRGPGSN